MTVLFRSQTIQNGINIVTGLLSPLTRVTNTSVGTFTLNGATPVAVADTFMTANSAVVITIKTLGGTEGAYPVVSTPTPGTGFSVSGTAGDTSVYNYRIFG